nr:retrovirus-related Pol polyprotein from transposon TNT 1-94 [Tanacetum cinerariifolium]
MLIQQGEGSGTPTEPYHTPSQKAQPSSPTYISTSSIPTIIPIPTVIPIPTITQSEPTPLRHYTRRARITQSSALPPVADEPTSPVRDVSEGEACPTDSGFIADQDRATIAKSSTLPTIQHHGLLPLLLLRAERVKILEDNQGVIGARSADDAPIKGRRIDEEEGITRRVSSDTEEIRLDEGEVAVERTSEDIEEMATVLTFIDAAIVLEGGIDVPTGSYSIPTAGPPDVDIHTGSDVVPTASSIVATATVVTLYSRRKGKEVMVESDTLKKQRLQEQIDAQVARELEEQQERKDKRMTEQIARDAEVARIHAEEELQGMIDSLDETNETIAKYLNNLGWKVKDFKGMTFEEIEAKFVAFWKLVEDFIPMGLKEEAERLKRKVFNLEQEKAKKQKTSEEVSNKEKSPEEIPKEKVKEMMQLVPIEEVYVQALQVKHPIIDWKHLDREDLNQLWVLVKEYLSIRPASSEKEMELWAELKRLVHHVTAKDKEIFMLVEKDYPLKKGLALVMISYKLQGRIVRNKMHKAFPLLVRKFPLPEGTSHCLKKNATARRNLLPLPEVCTAIIVKEKPSVKDDSFLWISAPCPALYSSCNCSDIGIQEKKAKLFKEWERFTSNEGESIETYYHCFLKLVNDLKRNKHFPKKIASNLKFLNNLQPKWSRHVTIVHQTKDLHTADYTQLYDFLKYNQKERISSNLRNRQITQPRMNMGQDRQIQMVGGDDGNQFRQYAGQNAGNLNGYNDVQNIKNQNLNGNGNLVAARVEGNAAGDAAYLQTQLLIAQKEEAGIQLQAEEFDLIVAAADLDEIEEVNANCILLASLQQASTSGTQTNKAPYTKLLEPILESHQVPQNDNNVISEVTSVEQSGGTVKQHPANVEETRALYDSHQSLAVEVEKVNTINRQLKKTNISKLSLNVRKNARKNALKTASLKRKMNMLNFGMIGKPPKIGEIHALSKPVTSNLILTPQELKVMNNDKVIAPGMFRINPFETSREEKHVPNSVRASTRTKPITVSQPPVFTKKDVNSDSNGLSSIGIDKSKTRRPQPRINTKNDRVLSTSKNSQSKNKEVEVEEHHRDLLLSKNNKHMSSACNNFKIDSQNVYSKVVCAICKQCLISVNNDECLLNYVYDKNSRGKKQTANVSIKGMQKKQNPKVKKPKKVGIIARRATPKPMNPRVNLTTPRVIMHVILTLWNLQSNGFQMLLSLWQVIQICLWCVDSGCSKHMTGNLKLLINFVWKFMGTVRFENDHVAAILGFSDLQWGNILITKVYLGEGLGHNLFSVGQFCDSDFEVAFRRNACFVRNLEGVYLLKGDRSTNLYTINLHEMASASPISLMDHASSTKSWLWHQRLSHLNFDTINDLAKNDLVTGLLKFKYHKEYLCSSCEQGKSKRASHPPKLVPNSRQRLHLLHMDLCGPMRIASINGKRYVLVIMDDYSRHTWVHFLISKDEAPEVIKTFLKRITVLL